MCLTVSNFLNIVSVYICAIVNNPHFLMCLFHLSTFFLRNLTIICTISCHLMISLSLFKFVDIAILFHPYHRWSSSLPNVFLPLFPYSSTKSTHFSVVSFDLGTFHTDKLQLPVVCVIVILEYSQQ